MSIRILVPFIIWVAFGIYLHKKTSKMLIFFNCLPIYRRMIIGSIGIILSGIILFMGLIFLEEYSGNINEQKSLGIWLAITLLGLIFVSFQVLSAIAIISTVKRKNITEKFNKIK